jgi:FAD/FMN-containing dehydrogenase
VAMPDQPALKINADWPWQLIAGFEGFEETVDYQLDGARTIVADAGLSDPQPRGYSPQQGICGEFFDVLEKAPFLLRTDVPPDEVFAFMSAVPGTVPDAAVLVDFGCGRIVAGASQLTDRAWSRWSTLARESRGHVLLEKAPLDFVRRHDVFGRPRDDWPLMHRIKAALDPYNVFAPVRSLGKQK